MNWKKTIPFVVLYVVLAVVTSLTQSFEHFLQYFGGQQQVSLNLFSNLFGIMIFLGWSYVLPLLMPVLTYASNKPLPAKKKWYVGNVVFVTVALIIAIVIFFIFIQSQLVDRTLYQETTGEILLLSIAALLGSLHVPGLLIALFFTYYFYAVEKEQFVARARVANRNSYN